MKRTTCRGPRTAAERDHLNAAITLLLAHGAKAGKEPDAEQPLQVLLDEGL